LWEIALPSGPVLFIRRPGQSVAAFVSSLPGPFYGEPLAAIESFLQHADAVEMVEFLWELEAAVAPSDHRPHVR
jgi:hypothetical protein